MKELKPLTPKTLEYTTTKQGKLRGFKQRDIYHFLGVQYAQAQRWQTAVPVKPWKGIKNALNFGNRAFAGNAFTPWDSCGVAHELFAYDEDCLNLNIWTPSIDPDARKPVMVWIHGGGFGSGCDMEMQCHDGENLARFGDVVSVGLNHRLNVFGFLDVSRFGPAYANSGNCGMSDLVAALKWVQENISAFGGDPDNVMIYGQSGGGSKVAALLQIPEADGLFHKAVIMSSGVRDSDESSDLSDIVLQHLLDTFHTDKIEDLLEVTSEEILEASKSAPVPGGASAVSKMISWHPIANDWYLGNVYSAGMREHAKTIPVMLGSTISEMPEMRILNKHSYSPEEQEAIVAECFPGQDVSKVIELFRKAWPDKCLTDLIEIKGPIHCRPGMIAYADLRAKEAAAPTYNYIFAHDFPQEGGRGAWHCADLPVVFRNSALYPDNFSDGVLDGLEDAMCASWVNFARFGNPNNDYLKVEWPAYTTGQCATMVFDNTCTVRCDFDRELVAERDRLQLTKIEKYTKFSQTVN